MQGGSLQLSNVTKAEVGDYVCNIVSIVSIVNIVNIGNIALWLSCNGEVVMINFHF